MVHYLFTLFKCQCVTYSKWSCFTQSYSIKKFIIEKKMSITISSKQHLQTAKPHIWKPELVNGCNYWFKKGCKDLLWKYFSVSRPNSTNSLSTLHHHDTTHSWGHVQACMHASSILMFLPGKTDNDRMFAAGKKMLFSSIWQCLIIFHLDSRYRKAKAGFKQDLCISGQVSMRCKTGKIKSKEKANTKRQRWVSCKNTAKPISVKAKHKDWEMWETDQKAVR